MGMSESKKYNSREGRIDQSTVYACMHGNITVKSINCTIFTVKKYCSLQKKFLFPQNNLKGSK